jgi:(p)ppGpp synthase/HD superfamily hydrolase
MGVACLVLEAGGDEDQAIAALLHDVVEDCGGAVMQKKVEKRFGKRVARIVEGCTDTDAFPKPPWRARKESYLQRLRDEHDEIRLVSAADKLHNARGIVTNFRECGEHVWERFNGKRDGTLWYYRELAAEFRRKPNALTKELDLVVRELHRMSGRRKK